MSIIYKLKQRYAALSKKGKMILGAAIAVVIILFILALTSAEDDEGFKVSDTRDVQLISVLSASVETSELEVTGTVRSESESNLRTETQGEVTGVYVSAGQFVPAGTVIAELRNTSERASVAQAEANVEAAQANLDKATGGVRSQEEANLEIAVTNAENAYATAISTTVTSLQAVYATFNDAIVSQTDVLFSNPTSNSPDFNLNTSSFATENLLEQSRVAMSAVLERQFNTQISLSVDSDLETEIDTLESEGAVIRTYLDNMLSALNNAIPSAEYSQTDINVYISTVTGVRQSVNATLSTLAGLRDSLTTSASALTVAENNLELGVVGAQDEDVIALQAALKQAQAGLTAARANLARTLVISPISGTVSTLDIRRGDFVGAFELVAIISNDNALEVQTFITEADKGSITVGSLSTIDGKYNAIVTSVAPGLDPTTKKIEVLVSVEDPSVSLTRGASARVSIERNANQEELDEVEEIKIPISAVKIETNRTIVFSINDESKLVAHEIETGLVLGDELIIESGIDLDMDIVLDARGLREGQSVIVTN